MTSIVEMEEDHLVLTGLWAVGTVILVQTVQAIAEFSQAGYDLGWIMMKLPGKNGYPI